MDILCIENKNRNGNFTIGKTYRIAENENKFFGDYTISSDYLYIFIDKNIIQKIQIKSKNDEFNLFFCKFKIL